jgi:putative transposase
MSKSVFYYRQGNQKRGRKRSESTELTDGNVISNTSVAIAIRFVLSEEFMISVGYINITKDLQSYGFIINKKKVYRLMKEYNLLIGSKIRVKSEQRRLVAWRVQRAEKPMEQLCMDIKYVYIQGARRNALLLTILDVFTRKNLGQVLWWSMRKENVIWLLQVVLGQRNTKEITIRTDNGSQFIAGLVREYLKSMEVDQEFTHVATPEENCFIEAYHSILEKQLLKYHEFASIAEAKDVFDRWRTFYNERKRHGSLGRKTPQQVWDEHTERVDPLRQLTAAKPEQMSRPAAYGMLSGALPHV